MKRSARATRSASPDNKIELPRSPTPTPLSSPKTLRSSLWGPESESRTAVSATSTSALTPTPDGGRGLELRPRSRAMRTAYYMAGTPLGSHYPIVSSEQPQPRNDLTAQADGGVQPGGLARGQRLSRP